MINPISKIDCLLHNCIQEVRRNPQDCFNHPDSAFTREHGPFTFENTIMASVTQGKMNMDDDASHRFFEAHNPSRFGTPSAFIQAKEKNLPECFRKLNELFVEKSAPLIPDILYKGCRLLGHDGTKVNMAPDPTNPDCWFPPKKEDGKGYSQFHLNAMTDMGTGMIVDFQIQPGRCSSERAALRDMAARYSDDIPAIQVADRGFESFALIVWLIINRIRFVIRGRDIHSNGIASSVRDLPEGEFDIDWNIKLTTRHTIETLSNPHKYKVLNRAQFEDIPEMYDLHLRIVRIQISEDSYEILLTNLDREEFPRECLKEIYFKRWGIEVEYFKLKYRIGLNRFQSKKPDLIMIEVASRILLHNICTVLSCIIEPDTKGRSPDGYKLDFSAFATWL